ncbi:MAG: hypothetical protein HY549_06760 [Elusimicrobia bacterium]|nr:hypothetical protein [Elusimicrobiota bacterium]
MSPSLGAGVVIQAAALGEGFLSVAHPLSPGGGLQELSSRYGTLISLAISLRSTGG